MGVDEFGGDSMKKLFYSVVFTLTILFGTTLTAMAASNHVDVTYGADTVRLYFDERIWTLGADNDPNNVSYEYVTDGQNVHNWKELVTLQMRYGLQNEMTAEEFAAEFIERLRLSTDDKAEFSIIRDDPYDYMIEWKVNGHSSHANQHEIDRVIVGKDSLIILHYVKKTNALTEEEANQWIGILDSAVIE